MASATMYKESHVWQTAMALAVGIYQLTTKLPPAERLGLSASLQRAATAIPTTLAANSDSRGQLLAACQASQTHAAELETLLILTSQMYPNVVIDGLLDQLQTVRGQLKLVVQRLNGDGRRKSL